MKEFDANSLRVFVEGKSYPQDYTADERARITPRILKALARKGL
jgi:hypothetical protein